MNRNVANLPFLDNIMSLGNTLEGVCCNSYLTWVRWNNITVIKVTCKVRKVCSAKLIHCGEVSMINQWYRSLMLLPRSYLGSWNIRLCYHLMKNTSMKLWSTLRQHNIALLQLLRKKIIVPKDLEHGYTFLQFPQGYSMINRVI